VVDGLKGQDREGSEGGERTSSRIESMTLDEVRAMLECGAILDDAIELMWGVGADRSEIVQALRWAAEKMNNYREEDQI
jgi:hypothetical protein